MNPAEFVARHAEVVRPLFLAESQAWWGLNTTGKEEFSEQARDARERIARVYANGDEYRLVKDWDKRGAAREPLAARQIRLLRLAYEGARKDEETIRKEAELSTRLEEIFANHRPVVRGEPASRNEMVKVLRKSTDSALRREMWEASQAVGAEARPVLEELVALRNRTAKRLRHGDHYALSLSLSELDGDFLAALLDDLEARTEAPFAAEKAAIDGELSARLGVPAAELMPWHYADPFFQDVPDAEGVDLDAVFAKQDLKALTIRTFEGLGLDVRGTLAQSDLLPRQGKCEHALCIHIDREGDVRVLANIEPNEQWMMTMLHEFGHAAYDRYVSPDLPFLLKTPAHSLMTEAVAMLLQRLGRDRVWLHRVAGVPAAEAEALSERLLLRERREKLIMMRWMLVMCRFERALYGESGIDRNARWWDLKERLQRLARPAGRSAPDWAAKIHLSVAPVYYQNYLLGELVASQLESWLRSLSPAGELVDNRAAGRALVDRLFRPGALRDWRSALAHATGADLDPAHFLRQYRLC